jgi:PD-(D/E)XK nuclease superfamily
MAYDQAAAITSWSFSRWSTYGGEDGCPYRAKLLYVDKLKEPKAAPLERGAAIHDLATDYIKGVSGRLPKELSIRSDEFRRLRAARRKDPATTIVEETWARTKSWGPSAWNDWDGCWVRIKLDVAEFDPRTSVLDVTDWKTGKYRPEKLTDYLLQLSLYGLGGLLEFLPKAPSLTVRPRLVYLDVDAIHDTGADGKRLEYTAADLRALKREWEARVRPMMNDRRFAPRPGRYCARCHFRRSNGGPCRYG